MVFRNDDTFRAIVEEYAQDNDLFLSDFRDAWIKLVNADRFGDVCVMTEEEVESTKVPSVDPTSMELPGQISQDADLVSEVDPVTVTCETTSESSTLIWILIIILLVVIVAQLVFMYIKSRDDQKKRIELEMSAYGSGGGEDTKACD